MIADYRLIVAILVFAIVVLPLALEYGFDCWRQRCYRQRVARIMASARQRETDDIRA